MKFHLLFCLLLLTKPAFSFINIETLRQNNKDGFLGSASLRIAGSTGNTNKVTGSLSTINAYLSDEREILALADYRYGASRGSKDTNNGRFHLRHTHIFQSFSDLETFVQYQFDEFRKLNSRGLSGANLRTSLLKTETQFLNLGSGLFYERQDRAVGADKNDVRVNAYLSYVYQKKDLFDAYLVVYYQPVLRRTQDARVNADTGIEFKLSSRISLSQQVQISYDNDPPRGVLTTDVVYFSGLSIRY